MTSRREHARRASVAFAREHRRLAELVAAVGECPLGRATPVADRFAHLVRAVCFQQLAGRAATTIHGRLVAQLGTVTPPNVLAASDAEFRAAGVSANKAASMRDLAARVVDGRLELDRLGRFDDDVVIAELVQTRGIGRWTAQMFLMHQLGRLDVWPTGDLGVRNGHALLFDLASPLELRALEPAADAFRPYRSVLAWYCWQAVDWFDSQNQKVHPR